MISPSTAAPARTYSTYIPVRKSATMPYLVERTPVDSLTLTLNIPRKFTRARLVPENVELEVGEKGSVTIPRVNGYARFGTELNTNI